MKATTRKFLKRIIPQAIKDFLKTTLSSVGVWYYSRNTEKIILRKNTSDDHIFVDLFMFNELRLPIEFNPKLIVDAGAYGGYSALYYSRKYPNAKIIAIEPEQSNFDLLITNTKHLDNVTRIKAGIWHSDSYLKVVETFAKCAFVVKEVSEDDSYDAKAISIDSILKNSEFDTIDILKVDIEGSENELFSVNSESWIHKVNVIVIELHDRYRDGCTTAFYSAIVPQEWDEYVEGEKVILIRKNLIK
jgi:FkbM family methyltransferase